MTTYADKGPRPERGAFLAFHHLTFWVSNAKQAASYYVTRFGFAPLAYRGLETGSRHLAAHVVRLNKIVLEFVCEYGAGEDAVEGAGEGAGEEAGEARALGEAVRTHGDFVRDIAFEVEELEAVVAAARARRARVLHDVHALGDGDDAVRAATLQTYGSVVHTLLERAAGSTSAAQPFLPGYAPASPDPIADLLPAVQIEFIDHVVGNQPEGEMESAVSWYERCLGFHRFWSVDDKQVCTEYSALRSVVMANWEESIKLPINEPARGKRKSQIQEYVEYHGGAGVQHVALNTDDIVAAVRLLRARGVRFLDIPDAYYELVRARLATSALRVHESLDELQELRVLIDYDERGYLLQIFTAPTQDRPTLFFELIQRRNHNGFGAGNFKTLFESLEMEQKRRGNL